MVIDNIHYQPVLDAALELFLKKGYARTTMDDISVKSGVRTGSIYRSFKRKADIAAALWGQAVAGWSKEVRDTPQEQSAEDAIKASVNGLLRWGSANPELFRLFEELKVRAQSESDFDCIKQQIHKVHLQGEALYATWEVQGVVKLIPWAVASALIVGPAYTLLSTQRYVSDEDRECLVNMAWEAVKK
ncbi:DNA-binding transcriptional repressor AcrR [Pseudovibrio axinellae]|uniref:DNA-binding transcriptional repressor AcrR n=1 Tax=Pseudovibrio axinellae TaxID=989403 RepID=A0A165ULL4_9HYPH|nr:TetR/AcrR family transcriptional regulator [Pseudovibrio axinellae]KZL12517.1 DNA-binding transcriptional repressor AcrR [Pseudovibrio axinellae]SEP68832.1 transcriptional regulator, TetR family [Pseudovibrio axinellae]